MRTVVLVFALSIVVCFIAAAIAVYNNDKPAPPYHQGTLAGEILHGISLIKIDHCSYVIVSNGHGLAITHHFACTNQIHIKPLNKAK